jgi:hypothetical protein
MPRTKRPRGQPESQVMRECLDILWAYRGAVTLERRNVGGSYNGSGQYVAFSSPDASDFTGHVLVGPHRGKRIDLELKRGDFDPRKARGEPRERFRRQLARLDALNRAGGIGLWVRDAADLAFALDQILAGARIELDEQGFPYLVR